MLIEKSVALCFVAFVSLLLTGCPEEQNMPSKEPSTTDSPPQDNTESKPAAAEKKAEPAKEEKAAEPADEEEEEDSGW